MRTGRRGAGGGREPGAFSPLEIHSDKTFFGSFFLGSFFFCIKCQILFSKKCLGARTVHELQNPSNRTDVPASAPPARDPYRVSI